MNVVISTTIGWNIGDQFILNGVKELLRRSWGRCQYVHHDRNPAKFLRGGGEESHTAIDCGWADALVIAGSPGWTTECGSIYWRAMQSGVPVYLVGIGAGAPADALALEVAFSPNIIWALSSARLVICRDEITRDLALRYRLDAELLPCPAAVVAWVPSNTLTENSGGLTALGPFYADDWHLDGLMAHQIADLHRSTGKAFYSECPADYLMRYARATHVASARLHASVVCRAMSVPVTNLWPSDDYRCAGAWSVLESAMRTGLAQKLDKYCELLGSAKP